ncbi:hypothetical protein OG756_15985 [Streptomyces sp. NBC_01310]|uniref:hypothetical protein n=1 Tax=Streptomyces sp. NBC_01310 TaxID=2903820 RepID=UPI0035B5A710|nr:hypothetical protein OG756_15985 [Streptomyces sp. NBC_01310]
MTTGYPDAPGSTSGVILLEPFVDTGFTPEGQAATLASLGEVGLGPAEVAGIREKVAPLMRAYNDLHWDWHHLGVMPREVVDG